MLGIRVLHATHWTPRLIPQSTRPLQQASRSVTQYPGSPLRPTESSLRSTGPPSRSIVPARHAGTSSGPVKIPPNMVLERTLNQVTLMGRVGGNPLKKGSIEHPMVEFSLATHSSYKDDTGEQTQKTDWHRICVFKPSLRELVFTYLKRGQRVFVTGKIVYSSTKQDNVTQNRVSIFADQVIFFQGTPEEDDSQ